MIVYLVEVLLWVIVAALGFAAAVKGRILFREGTWEGTTDFLRLLPKIALGVVGSGYLAAVLPTDVVAHYLGPDSGFLGVCIAVVAGTLTPGGPVVGFSIGAAAFKGGAGGAQVVAYTTAWALYAIQRVVLWELPIMPARFVWLRWTASLPLPFIAAAGAMLLGKP